MNAHNWFKKVNKAAGQSDDSSERNFRKMEQSGYTLIMQEDTSVAPTFCKAETCV